MIMSGSEIIRAVGGSMRKVTWKLLDVALQWKERDCLRGH